MKGGLEVEILRLAWIRIALLTISFFYVIEEQIVRKNIVNYKVLVRHMFLGTLRILVLFALEKIKPYEIQSVISSIWFNGNSCRVYTVPSSDVGTSSYLQYELLLAALHCCYSHCQFSQYWSFL